MTERKCKDCAAHLRRPAPYPGPRCATHNRAEAKRRKAANHERYVGKTYALAPGDYAKLYEAQGGRCAICLRATGRSKKLAVDHAHECCPGPVSCGKCVRGLLCKTCNHDVLGHLRHDPAAFERAAEYLRNPPARRVLGRSA